MIRKNLLDYFLRREAKRPLTSESVSVAEFRRAIQRLPSDEPNLDSGVWYTTQKEHWLGWLRGYSGPGAYGRKGGEHRNARFAYNHIVCDQMLLWLIDAAGIPPERIAAAHAACEGLPTLQQRSAAIRKHVPWEMIFVALWE